MSAVPQLLNYTDDPSLDAQTHAWAFHALERYHAPAIAERCGSLADWYETKIASFNHDSGTRYTKGSGLFFVNIAPLVLCGGKPALSH